MKKFLIFIIVLFFCENAFSQEYNTTFYSTETSNIVSNSIADFEFDNNGNVWITHGSAQYGISMFNGTSFVNYIPDINIPTDVTFKDIEIDNNNNIWVLVWQKFEYGYNNGCNCYPIGYSRALLFFDGTNWEYYTPTNSQLPTISYGSIKTDSLGNVWFITSQGLSRFDGNNLVVYSPSAFSLPTPENFYENNFMEIDDNDIVWIASFGLISFNNGNWVLYSNPIEPYPFYEVSKIYNNNIYLDGYYKFDGNNFTIFSSYNGCDFYDDLGFYGIDKLDFDSQGNLWITYVPQSGFYINDSFYYVSLKRTENCSYYLSGEWYESGEDYEYVGCSQMKIDNYDNIWGVKNYSEG